MSRRVLQAHGGDAPGVVMEPSHLVVVRLGTTKNPSCSVNTNVVIRGTSVNKRELTCGLSSPTKRLKSVHNIRDDISVYYAARATATRATTCLSFASPNKMYQQPGGTG